MIDPLILGALIVPQLLYWTAKFLALDIWGIYQEVKALRQKGNV